MVLAGLGHALTESQIRFRCQHTSVGMRLNQIGIGLSDLPVIVEHHVDWGIDDLSDLVRVGAHPIVAVDLRPIDGVFAFHAVVVVGVGPDRLLIHDPRDQSGSNSIGLSGFEAGWSGADREAVIIKAK